MWKLWKKQPKSIKGLMITIVIAFLIVLLYIAGHTTFSPASLDVYEIGPEEVCPLGEITSTYTATINDGPYTLGHMQGYAYWVEEGDYRPYGNTYVDSDIEDTNGEPVTVQSPARRAAPALPGKWRAAFDITLEGRMLGIVQAEQHILRQSDNYITVLPWSDPTCGIGDGGRED